MNTLNKPFSLALIFVLLFFGFTSIYTVNEGQSAIKLFLGKIVRESKHNRAKVIGPGLHFKLPFLHQIRIFDTRLQTKDIEDSRFVTAEKKDVLVNYYIKWRIGDLPLYFTRTGGNAANAETLLEQQLNDGLRAEFGKRTIREVVSSERSDVMTSIQQQADKGAHALGIDVIDVRIKAIDLPPEVSSSVYARMGAERERIAAEHRALGRSKAEAIRADADAKSAIIIARAEREAKKIRGEGDAEAAAIYAQAYNRNPELFAFMKSLNAYRNSFSGKDDWFILEPNFQFFKYFKNPGSAKKD